MLTSRSSRFCQDLKYFKVFYQCNYLSHIREIYAIRILGCCEAFFMTNSEILKRIADGLGLRIKKSNIVGVGAILEIKDKKGFTSRLSSYPQWIQIEIKIKNSFTIAFNESEGLKPLGLTDYPCRLFVSGLEDKEQIVEFANDVKALIREIDLKNIESITLSKNQILADFLPNRDPLVMIDKLIEIVRHIDKGPKINKEINDLPDNLKDLYHLLEKYSISDDLQRDGLIDTMTTKEAKYLIDLVGDRIQDINDYLASFADRPLTENAQQLGALAELVSELKNASQQQL